ncbi:hypothetical protein FF1_025813 [Malus domestica]
MELQNLYIVRRRGASMLFALVVVISIFGVSTGNFFHLHRAFPMNHHVELEQLQALDRVRHHQFLGGVVNVSVALPKHIHYPIGIYLTKVKIGSPPREFYVLIDTGSEVFWVSCSSCNVCPLFTGLGMLVYLLASVLSGWLYIALCNWSRSLEC